MKNRLCPYKNLLGLPNTGLRKYRIFDIAIYDVLVTAVIVYIITYFTNLPFWPSLGFIFILGIFAHRLFCVRTGVDKLLFPDGTLENF